MTSAGVQVFYGAVPSVSCRQASSSSATVKAAAALSPRPKGLALTGVLDDDRHQNDGTGL